MNVAIVVAAGSGTRFGGKTPKQFLEIAGQPLIIHSLKPFQSCSVINQIVLVLPAGQGSGFLSTLSKYGITKITKIVSGGQTRAESVYKGLKAVHPLKTEIVAVHDGARPLVAAEEIAACVEQARQTGAAILTAPVTDTIKMVADGRILRTIDRETLRRALTPQCFRYPLLRRAFENSDLSAAATDESFLAEQMGIDVAIVEGSTRNIKVTSPEDFKLAERLLKEKNV